MDQRDNMTTGVDRLRSRMRKIFAGVVVVALPAAALIFAGAAKAAGPTCNVPTDYATIQLAVTAPGCGTINVAPGAYAENLVINRTVTLNGAQAGIDARTRSGSESIINGAAAANITINADGVTVDGFTINGPVSQGAAAIVMMGGNTGETIQNNIINNPGRAASFNTSTTVFSKNLVNNNFATAGDGFQANSSPVHDVTISDNTFGGANGQNYNADITIIEGKSNVSVSGNASNRDGTLIALFKTNVAHITNNNVIGDGLSSAIYIGGADSNVTVSGNTVSSAGSAVKVADDFGVGPNSSVTITGNNLHNNTAGVKVGATAVTSAGAVVANRNSLTGNSGFGVNNLSSFNADATCNWWGVANGPGPVGPGSGDKVSTNVTFAPWLISSNVNGACIGGNVATNKDQCKEDGWQTRTRADGTTFKNQGDCIQYVNTGK